MSDFKNIPMHSFKNRSAVERSANCGCYRCAAVFAASEINSWTDNHQTAICPNCECDTVLPEYCGVLLNETTLKDIQKFWFPEDDKS